MSVLPFPSFLDDVKEKGLKKAVFELVDESVERLTAGLNIQDIREAMRGEPLQDVEKHRNAPECDGDPLPDRACVDSVRETENDQHRAERHQ